MTIHVDSYHSTIDWCDDTLTLRVDKKRCCVALQSVLHTWLHFLKTKDDIENALQLY